MPPQTVNWIDWAGVMVAFALLFVVAVFAVVRFALVSALEGNGLRIGDDEALAVFRT